MASRSRFYVDTPRDPTQRHSMFVSHSELEQGVDHSSNSSSATLPSPAGSVDRLTGLEGKKSSRFFTLKPKGSFSLKPFFRSSTSSLVSLSPDKRRKNPKTLERRDSGSQTDDSRPEFGEIGVQTLNASTVDVPVQTSFQAWEEGESYGQRRLAYSPASRSSPFWSRPYAYSSSLSSSATTHNVPKDPLASPRLVKYVAPRDFTSKTAPSNLSTVTAVDVNSCQPVSPPVSSPDSANVPVKHSTKEQIGSPVPLVATLPCDKDTKVDIRERYDNVCPPPSEPDTINEDKKSDVCQNGISPTLVPPPVGNAQDLVTSSQLKCDPPVLQLLSGKVSEVSPDSKFEIQTVERPAVSVLKTERTDSPSKRLKTVHFDLPSPEPQTAVIHTSLKLRNLDKDFEALLKDLNAWTDEDDVLQVSFDNVPKKSYSSPTFLSQNLKSAIDCLKQDFLASIPEISNESVGDDQDKEPENKDSVSKANKVSAVISDNLDCDTNAEKETVEKTSDAQDFKPLLIRSISEYDNQVPSQINVSCCATQTPEPIFTKSNSGTNAETNSLEGNVYDNVIKEENPVQTVALPTLPSFFEPPSRPQVLTAEIVEYVNENSSDRPSCSEEQTAMPFDPAFEHSRTSRSSSRSSIRSSKAGMDGSEQLSKFDSCENLDQLEEEIIRSLYSPDEETIMKNIELPPSESFQNSGTTATHMRRVILDQLLSGKSVEDIVPNYSKQQTVEPAAQSRSKFKPPKKYSAVLTKFETDENYQENSVNTLETVSTAHSVPSVEALNEKLKDNTPSHVEMQKMEAPKKTSVFLFPEMDLTSQKVPEKSDVDVPENRGPSVLEVRRSSWTPQAGVDSVNDSTSACAGGSQYADKRNLPDIKNGYCDFTNCLKPSKIQNSPFLTKINTRSMSPCNFSPLPTANPTVPPSSSTKRDTSPVKQPAAVGECDYRSCLRPSQVQNSVFTRELSEITSGNSINSLRARSPLTVLGSSPRRGSLDHPNSSPVPFKSKNSNIDAPEPVTHKSEFSIILKPSTHRSDAILRKQETLQCPKVIDTPDISEASTIDAPWPPPPPPPLPSNQTLKSLNMNVPVCTTMESMIQDKKSNLNSVAFVPIENPSSLPATAELRINLQMQNESETSKPDFDDQTSYVSAAPSVSEGEQNVEKFANVNGSTNYSTGSLSPNGNIRIISNQDYSMPDFVKNGDTSSYGPKLTYATNTVVTDEPPPPGAVLLDQKVIVDGDKVHTDKYYAIPMREVLKEKTSTTKFIPAPPKYEGIGPTEEGVPIGLRNSVKKENMHNWYKTMFKSLHKADSSNDSQEYIIGYTSEPETSKKDIVVKKKSSTLDSHPKQDVNSNYQKPYPSAKSSIEVYNVRPRLIEDYEPGYSSVTDDEVVTSRRYLPSLNTPKPSYEFKNGYESDTSLSKKRDQPPALSPDQQKMWYREIQRGSDIPQFGLGKTVPEKPNDPVIGPLPPPPLNYSGPIVQQQGVRPPSLPADYSNQNGSSYCQQMNGVYELHMRQAIHSEMQQRRSPSSNQLSPPIRTMAKSPSRSPDLKIPAQALFDFKAESPKEISLKKGDMVLILRQLDKNWYEGEHKGVVGIFPISYVEIVPPEHASTPIKPRSEGLGRALYDFVAQTSVELTVRKGDTIILLRRVDSNWFEAVINKKKGIVPISYIQVLHEPAEISAVSPPRSCPVSPSSESREKLQKIDSLSPSAYSSSSMSPKPVSPVSITPILKNPGSQERTKLTNKKSSNLVEPVMYRALYSYSPQNADELELQEGDSVCVVEMCDDGWFVGTSVRTGTFGIFPGNYVEKTS